MSVICYINNQPMTSSQCKLFDLYQKYLAGNATKQDFINFEGYGNTFEVAKSIYEKAMKFNSQICTTKEQSERLLALGLKRETADMGWVKLLNSDGYVIAIAEDYSFIDIPAWSLHRLIEMYTEHYICEHINLKLLTYGTIIENIRLDILSGTFNKEYLN